MRINVYAEELTTEVEIVEKVAKGHTQPFYGVRMYLASPKELHHSKDDDDRSAITFWVPWTVAKGNDFYKVIMLLDAMKQELYYKDNHLRDLEGVK